METPSARDAPTAVSPPEGMPEHAAYLHTLDRIARLTVWMDQEVRAITCLQAQISGFDGGNSYYALVAMAEQLANRARVVAHQEHDLRDLHRQLDELCAGATDSRGPALTVSHPLFSDVFPYD